MIYNDIYCLDTADPFFAPVGGTLALGQDLCRRLMSPRGSHPTDINYGTNIRSWINSNFSEHNIFVYESLTKTELVKDRRVIDVEVDITVLREKGDGSFRMKIKVFTEEEPFSLDLVVGPVEGNSEGSVASAVNNIRSYVWTVTDVPQSFMNKNVNRKGLLIQNTSAGVPVYYAWGVAPTTSSLTWPANRERQVTPVHTGALYLMTPAGTTAIVKAEETY